MCRACRFRRKFLKELKFKNEKCALHSKERIINKIFPHESAKISKANSRSH